MVRKRTTATRPFHATANGFGDYSTGSGLMLIVNGAATPNQTVWQQTVVVAPGTSYAFSGWVASWGNSFSGGSDLSPAQLRFFVNGSQIGSDFTALAAGGQWSQFSAAWNSGSSTSATFRIVDLNLTLSGNDFVIDDLALRAVPEPTALISTALGLIALAGYAGRRRCRRALA